MSFKVGKITHPVYFRHFQRCREQRWKRSWPNGQSHKIWWRKYLHRQRIASNVAWDSERWTAAWNSLDKEMEGIKLNPLSLEKAPTAFSDLGASPGIDLEGKRYCPTKGDLPFQSVLDMWDVLKEGKHNAIPDYAIAFRSHLVREDDPPKARVVLVSPGPLAVVEKCWAEPLYIAMKSCRYPRPWATGFDWFAGDGHRILQTFGKKSLSIDFSSYDICAPTFLIKDVFRLIGRRFQMSDEERKVFHSIMQSHIRGHARLGTRRFPLTGGIRTGSSFTHLIGTLACILIIRYLLGPDVVSVSYGDDAIINTNVSLKELSRRAHATSSYIISETKSSRGVHWLGLKRTRGVWEVENPDRRWGQMFNPEYIGDCADLQTQLLQSHLLAAGTGHMAAEIRGIISDLDIRDISMSADRQIRKCVYLPLGSFQLAKAKDILEAESRLKIHMV